MKAVAETSVTLPSEAHWLHKPVFIGFLCVFAANLAIVLLRIENSGTAAIVEALLVLTAAATLIVGLARRLPFQNVVASTTLIGALSALVTVTSQKTGVPFGPAMYTDSVGPRLFGLLPWVTPFVWVIALLSSRGVARLIVRPWRKTNYYGFWVIGLTVLFTLTLVLGLEPYAGRRRFWIWQTPATVWNWLGAPWTNFLGWAVVALGIVVVATPWLINKNPVKQPTDYHPLVVWLLLNFYFAAANALQQCWLAVILCLSLSTVATVFAVKGARW